MQGAIEPNHHWPPAPDKSSSMDIKPTMQRIGRRRGGDGKAFQRGVHL
jgi:hypothetical protein